MSKPTILEGPGLLAADECLGVGLVRKVVAGARVDGALLRLLLPAAKVLVFPPPNEGRRAEAEPLPLLRGLASDDCRAVESGSSPGSAEDMSSML